MVWWGGVGGLEGGAGEGEQCHVAGAFDGLGDDALLVAVEAGALARLDFTVRGEHTAKVVSHFVVDEEGAVAGGESHLSARSAEAIEFCHDLFSCLPQSVANWGRRGFWNSPDTRERATGSSQAL